MHSTSPFCNQLETVQLHEISDSDGVPHDQNNALPMPDDQNNINGSNNIRSKLRRFDFAEFRKVCPIYLVSEFHFNIIDTESKRMYLRNFR